MIFPLALLDREVIYTGNAPAHKAVLIEFPVLVAVAAKPAAAIIMPFVGKTHGDAVLAEGPDFLDQAVVKLTAPLARQERFDGNAPLKKFRAIAPATIGRIGKRDASRIARIPSVFGHSHFLRGGLGCEGRERRAAHLMLSFASLRRMPAPRERRRCRRTADKRDELAASHGPPGLADDCNQIRKLRLAEWGQ